MDHLMAEKNENNKDSQKGQVTPKKYFKKKFETGHNNINDLFLQRGRNILEKHMIQTINPCLRNICVEMLQHD